MSVSRHGSNRPTSSRVLAVVTAALLLVGLSLIIGILVGRSQRDERPSAAGPTTTAVSPPSSNDVDVQLDTLRDRQNHLDSWNTWALLPLAVVTSVLGAGGVVGIVLSFRNEIRTGQIHDLLVSGESAQQARTEEVHAVLLDASQKTLTLVNDTLELARDASERAAKTLSQRAERLLGEIGQEASSLFLSVYHHREFPKKGLKVLVEAPEIRNEILDLAQRLASIEGYLEFQEIPLTASAYLIKGMAHHFKQDEQRAIRDLEKAAEIKESTNPKLKQVAYYWAGYSCNNVGRFSQAASVFASARRFAERRTPLFFELSRMEEESRFFDVTRRFFEGDRVATPEFLDEADHILRRIEGLGEQAHKLGEEGAAHALWLVAGNICFWRVRVTEGSARQSNLRRAIENYDKAGDSLWARFGRAEARRERSPRSQGIGAAYETIEQLANNETQKRAEPRSVTLLYLTIVICMKQQRKSKSEIDGARRLLWNAFAGVDGSVTLYSQHWKTNVPREVFEDWDLRPLERARAPRRRTS